MADPSELRQHAARCRRIANVRTEGGQAADRRLLELARNLEALAARIEEMPEVNDKDG